MIDDESIQPTLSSDTINKERRQFLCKAASILGGVGALCALSPFISSMMPNAKTRENARPIHVNISQLRPGQQITVVWQGLPIWKIRWTKTHSYCFIKKEREKIV